jgi:hypothetical protein
MLYGKSTLHGTRRKMCITAVIVSWDMLHAIHYTLHLYTYTSVYLYVYKYVHIEMSAMSRMPTPLPRVLAMVHLWVPCLGG